MTPVSGLAMCVLILIILFFFSQLSNNHTPIVCKPKRLDDLYFKSFWKGALIGGVFGLLFCLFMAYKGCERHIQQYNINKHQHYDLTPTPF